MAWNEADGRSCCVLLVATLVGLIGGGLPAAEPDATIRQAGLESLLWLVGAWSGEESGVVSEELWLAPAGGIMLGLHRDVGPGGGAFFEYLRIVETDAGLSYIAQPLGRSPTEFRLREIGKGRVVFENQAHDYPQRIIYRTAPDGKLFARVEGEVDGETRSSEWTWSREE